MPTNKFKLKSTITNLLNRLKPDGRLLVIENESTGMLFQSGFGLRSLFTRKSDIKTGGRSFKKKALENNLNNCGGHIISEKIIPLTTMAILPICGMAKIVPEKIVKFILAAISKADKKLEHSSLPSFSVAYLVGKGRK